MSFKIILFLKRIDFKFWRFKIWYRAILNNTQGEVGKIIWVNPKMIKKVGIGWGKFKRLDEMGKVKEGDWDLNTMNFEELDVYQSLKERLLTKLPWEDLPYYKSIKNKILNGENPFGLKSLNDFEKRLKNLELLYLKIKENGYQVQQKKHKSGYLKKNMDEITVRIARNGELLFENGRHRLSIAKILNLSKIPVLVTWRHKEWNNFIFSLKKYCKKNNSGFLNYTIDDFEFNWDFKEDERYNLIKKNLKFKKGTVLDLGANLGYFSHKFENDGFECFAIEPNKENFDLLNKIRIILNKKFTAINIDILGFNEKSNFDIILALNILYPNIKDKEYRLRMKNYLNRLNAGVIFFQSYFPNEKISSTLDYVIDDTEFVDFICDNTGLTKWEVIGTTNNGKSLYKIYS